MTTRPRVLILFNEPTLPADHPDADSEYDVLDTADTVAGILNQSNVAVERLEMRDDPTALLDRLKAGRPDAVFNLYEGLARWGNTEAYVAGLLEMMRVPFTGSPTQPLMLCRSKPLTKSLLAGAGLPTAPFFVVDDGAAVPRCRIDWPVIVKPGREDASVGIDQSSVVTSQPQLEDRVEYVRARYGPSVLVERFVRGREFNVAVLERDGAAATLPYSEIFFEPPADRPDLWPIVSFDAKWKPGTLDFTATPVRNPADVDPELRARVDRLSLKAFELVGCRDYARVDFRVDGEGDPFILEVNPNPCISPLAGLAAALESARIPYGEFVAGLVRRALRRGPAPELADRVRHSPPPPRDPPERARPMNRPLSREYACTFGAPVLSAVDPRLFQFTYFERCMACTFCQDACCQYGADTEMPRVAALEAIAPELEAYLGVPRAGWFREDPEDFGVLDEPEYPGGKYTRTQVVDQPAGRSEHTEWACVFLDPVGRGCRLHRFALERGIDVHAVKPMVCLLFPASFDAGVLCPAYEFDLEGELVCQGPGPTIYRAARGDIGWYFGAQLVAELDAMEPEYAGRPPGPARGAEGRSIPLPTLP